MLRRDRRREAHHQRDRSGVQPGRVSGGLPYRAHPESMTANAAARLAGWRELASHWPPAVLQRWGGGKNKDLERVLGEQSAQGGKQ